MTSDLIRITLDLDRKVVEAFREQGPDWEARMGEILRTAAAIPPPAESGLRPDQLNATNDD